MNVKVWDYADRGNKAHGITIGKLDLYFSYQTCIAFRDGGRIIVRQNSWARTTGGHLNSIDGGGLEAKKRRVSAIEFERQLEEVLSKHNLVV